MKKLSVPLLEQIRSLSRQLPAQALIAALMGIGLTLPLHAALSLPGSMGGIVLLCVGVAGWLALLCINRWTRWIGGVLSIGLLAAWVLLGSTASALVRNLPQAFTLALQGRLLALRLFSAPLMVLCGFAFTFIGFELARRSGGFYPALSLTMVVLLGVWFYGERSQMLLCLPALLGLVMMYAVASEFGTALHRILPMALLALLMAMLLLPTSRLTSPALEANAERLREIINDYLFFTEPRNTYSLQRDGYLPLGTERLGGPANPGDTDILEVRTTRPLLLRGTTKDTYTGQSWLDNGSSQRYLYIDPRLSGMRDNLFDLRRPDASARESSGLFTPERVSIQFLTPGVSTLFLPQRFASLHTGENMVPYFNATSEVFITRDTAPADAYNFTAFPLTADHPNMGASLESLRAQGPDPNYENVATRYLAIPQFVEPAVYDLTHYLTQGLSTPYDKAMALTRHLRSAYPYTLDQNIPPTTRDFLSWFLLEEQKGYCTSFATALAVMGRIVGLPTRYIEGYSVLSAQGGVSVVNAQRAHAWVEIYFENFGWVSFDPTPSPNQQQGGDDTPPPPMGDSDNPSPPPEASPEPTVEPSPSPEPTTEPTPEPTPEPDEESIDQPTPSPEPSPSPPPGEAPQENPPDQPPPDEPSLLWLLWLLIPILLIAALVWRFLATDPKRLAAKQTAQSAQLMVWYRALSLLLREHGLHMDAAESLRSYFERAEHALTDYQISQQRNRQNRRYGSGAKKAPPPVALMPTAEAICRLQYGGHTVEDQTFADAQAVYDVVWSTLLPHQKTLALLRRMVHGLGSLEQVP